MMLKNLNSSKPLTITSNIKWILFGNIFYSVCQWVMLMLMARMSSPEVVGQFALGLAITAPVIMFTNMQLRGIQATDANHSHSFNSYFRLRIITTFVAFVAITFIGVFGQYKSGIVIIIMIIGLAKCIEAISDIFFGLCQQIERMDEIAKRMIVKGLLSLGLFGVGLYVFHNLLHASIGLLISNLITLIFYDSRSSTFCSAERPQYDMRIRRKDIRLICELAWLALPLGIAMMLVSLKTNLPRYFIERYLGEYQLGIFAALAYVIVIGTTLVNSLGQVVSPRLSKYNESRRIAEFKKLFVISICISLGIGMAGILVAILAGDQILRVLYGQEYSVYGNTFILIMIAGCISYILSIIRYTAIALRVLKSQAFISLVSLLIMLLFCFWRISKGSLNDAAMALIIGFAVEAVAISGMLIRGIKKEPTHHVSS